MVNDTLMTRHLHSVRGLGRPGPVARPSVPPPAAAMDRRFARVTHTDFIWNYKTGRSALANNKNIYTSRRLAASTINQTVISRRAVATPPPPPSHCSCPPMHRYRKIKFHICVTRMMDWKADRQRWRPKLTGYAGKANERGRRHWIRTGHNVTL